MVGRPLHRRAVRGARRAHRSQMDSEWLQELVQFGVGKRPTENSRIDLHHDIGLVARLWRRWYAHASLVAQEDNLQSVGGGARLPAVRSKGIVVGQLDDLIAEALPQLGHVSAGGSVEARVDPLDCMLGRDFSRFRLTFRGALAANSSRDAAAQSGQRAFDAHDG